jgi:peptidoglycan/LPS O-acetylase OafA/YrhL
MPWYTYLSFTNNIWIAKHNFMEAFASPTWSLAIEEQFYLTLPLLVRMVKPKYFPALVAALITGIAGFRMAMGFAHAVTPIQSYVLSWFRADALMIGVACALAVRSDAMVGFITQRSWVLYLALATFGGIILSTGCALQPDTAAPINTYGFTVVALFFATLLLVAILLPHHPIARALRFRPLRSLGKLAYCVYLLHVSALLATFSVMNDTTLAHNVVARWIAGLACLCVVLVVATISWNLLESRMIQMGQRFTYLQPSPQHRSEDVLPLAG